MSEPTLWRRARDKVMYAQIIRLGGPKNEDESILCWMVENDYRVQQNTVPFSPELWADEIVNTYKSNLIIGAMIDERRNRSGR